MSLREDEELELRLRAAFEPDQAVVDRLVAGAMRPRPSRKPALRLAAALVLGAVAIAALMVWFRPPSVRAESVRLEYIGNVALIEYPDGSSWLLSPDATGQGPQIPLNLIIVEGGKP